MTCSYKNYCCLNFKRVQIFSFLEMYTYFSTFHEKRKCYPIYQLRYIFWHFNMLINRNFKLTTAKLYLGTIFWLVGNQIKLSRNCIFIKKTILTPFKRYNFISWQRSKEPESLRETWEKGGQRRFRLNCHNVWKGLDF